MKGWGLGVADGAGDGIAALTAHTTSLLGDCIWEVGRSLRSGSDRAVDMLRGWLMEFKSLPKIGWGSHTYPVPQESYQEYIHIVSPLITESAILRLFILSLGPESWQWLASVAHPKEDGLRWRSLTVGERSLPVMTLKHGGNYLTPSGAPARRVRGRPEETHSFFSWVPLPADRLKDKGYSALERKGNIFLFPIKVAEC